MWLYHGDFQNLAKKTTLNFSMMNWLQNHLTLAASVKKIQMDWLIKVDSGIEWHVRINAEIANS